MVSLNLLRKFANGITSNFIIKTIYMKSIIMNKVSVFCLLVSLFAFGSCHDDEETEFGNKVYTNFPDVFDVPAEGGKFLIKQTYNNDYFLTHCEASIRYVDSNGKITVSYDSIQSHDTTFVYGNGKVHSYSDRFYNSWFELKKENKHEISLVVTPNNTGGKREIVVGVRDILFEGWPQKIMIYQPAY